MAALRSMCVRNSQTLSRFISVKQSNVLSSCVTNKATYLSNRLLFRNLTNSTCHSFRRTTNSTPVRRLFSATCVRTVSTGFCLQLQQPRLYSTQSKDTNITSDILQSKIGDVNEQTDSKTEIPDPPSGSEKGSDEKKDEKKKDAWYAGKNAWKIGMFSLFASGIMICGNLVFIWGVPLTDDEGNEIPDEFSDKPTWQAYILRSKREAHFFKKMIEEPSFKKLLPDPLKEPWYQPPYTLVLEMTGILVHPDWTLGTGWRFKKRPGIQYFLQQVASPLYEVVIFTHEQGFTAFPIIDGLDPNGHVTFRLFRDATRYMNNAHVKDLDNMNRDLSKVIIVDCDPKSIQKHPRNALLLKKWPGTDGDTTLLDLAAFLKTIATSGVEDVRPVLEHYSQYDDPLEAFKENQRRLQQGEQERKSPSPSQNPSLAGFGKSFLTRR